MNRILYSFILIFSAGLAEAQLQTRKIEPDSYNNGKELFFYKNDGESSKLLLEDFNPFKGVGGLQRLGSKDLATRGEDLNSLITKIYPSFEGKSINNVIDNISSLSITNSIAVDNDYALVSYDTKLYGANGGIIGLRSQLIVFSLQGDIHIRLPQTNNGFFDPVITENGQYIAYLGGGMPVETDFSLLNNGNFNIYDVESGEVIFTLEEDEEISFLKPTSVGNMIVQVVGYPDDKYKYLVFFPEERTVYEKTYSRDEIGQLLSITPTSFVFKTKSYFFNTHFLKNSF